MEQVLTPTQEAFETQVKQSPIICKLEEEGKMLLEGQNSIQEHLNEVDDRLEDGSLVMDGLIKNVKEIFSFMNIQAQRSEEMHRETKDALNNHKYQDIKEELKAKQAQLEKKDIEIKDGKKRRWEILMRFLTGAISIGVSYLAFKYFG